MDDIKTINANDKNVEIRLNQDVYPLKTIQSAAIKYADYCFIDIDIKSSDTISIIFRIKPGHSGSLNDIAAEFKNRVLEQQIRCDLESSFGHIREMIVKQAFAPTER